MLVLIVGRRAAAVGILMVAALMPQKRVAWSHLPTVLGAIFTSSELSLALRYSHHRESRTRPKMPNARNTFGRGEP